jgi:hypothetical protein
MRTRARSFTLLIAAPLTLHSLSCMTSSLPQSAASPIPLKDLHARGLAGRLGPPLGTIVEVSGEVVPNPSKGKADVSEPFFLRVDAVDGRKLQHPQSYPSRYLRLNREVPRLKVGDRFQCVGYESGGYIGIVDGEFDYVPAYAAQGFHFAVEFVVLKTGGRVQPATTPQSLR